jgi:hypothetical protein
MTKNEFLDYVRHLDKLFNTNNADDKDILATWYKSFENTHLNTAKEMAQMYLQEEQGRFKLAKLLQYKSKALAGKTYFEGAKDQKCILCNDTGFIQVEIPYRTNYTTICRRCICKAGQALNKSIRQVTSDEIQKGDFKDGVIRRMDLHQCEETETENDIQFNKIFGRR